MQVLSENRSWYPDLPTARRPTSAVAEAVDGRVDDLQAAPRYQYEYSLAAVNSELPWQRVAARIQNN